MASTTENMAGYERPHGFLSGTDISKELSLGKNGQIRILVNDKHIDQADPNVTHVGYDISLGDRVPFDLTDERFMKVHRQGSEKFITVPAGHTISVETAEHIELGDDVGALIKSKVRMVSRGYSHISTTIDPVWMGKLLLTFTNNSGHVRRLPVGKQIATVVFIRYPSATIGRSDVNYQSNDSTWQDYAEWERQSKKKLRTTRTFVWFAMLVLLGLVIWYCYGKDWFGILDMLNKKPAGTLGVALLVLGLVFTGIWRTATGLIKKILSIREETNTDR